MIHFQSFESNIEGIGLPEKFTYPFNYTPHPLADIAAKELQDYIKKAIEPIYDFGMVRDKKGTW